jgi:hypothetical protein
MEKILYLFLLIAAISCSKDKESCYECNISVGGVSGYQDVGCFTKEGWNSFRLIGSFGTELNKDQLCRKK